MKKGFTLIELLAVIVILAIIALIAIPIILNIIESVRIRAAVQSAYGYVDAVNYRMAKDKLSSEQISDATYDILETDLKAKYDGTGPTHGTVTILKSSVKEAKLCIMGYPITYENGKAYHDKESKVCPGVDSSDEEKDVWDGKTVSESLNGCGTEESPFLIKSAADLIYMRNQVNSNGTISLLDTNCGDSAVTSAKTASYKQTISIALNDTKNYSTWNDSTTGLNIWDSIGKFDNSFSGVYDGSGYTISGIYMPGTTSYQGFFGVITSPTAPVSIKNLNITKSYYSGNGTGTLIYYVEHDNAPITIDNCTSDVEIINPTSGSIGGLIGKVESKTSVPFTISNSSYNGKITNASYSGGLIGQFNSSNSGHLVINNSKNTADISGNDKIGGLVGDVNTLLLYINDSYNMGSINGKNEYSYIGGLIGMLYNKGAETRIQRSYNKGSVKGNNYVGGITGYLSGGTFQLKNSYNSASVTGNKWIGGLLGYGNVSTLIIGGNIDGISYNTGKIEGHSYVGGLLGYGYGSSTIVVYGYNQGTIYVSNIENQTFLPSDIGGLVGTADSNSIYISSSYNSGDIIEKNPTGKFNGAVGSLIGQPFGNTNINTSYNVGNLNVSSFEYNGGLVGIVQGNLTIKNAYNAGKITVSETSGQSIDYDFSAGGLVGNIYNGSSSTIENAYNIGNISINVNNESYLGGLVGCDSGYTSIKNSYNTGSLVNSNTSVTNHISGIVYTVPAELEKVSYLSTTAQHGFASAPTNTGATSVSSVGSMPSVFSVVSADSNSIFKEDTNNINNGYPILSYQ